MKKILVMGASALALGFGMSAAHAEDPMKLTLSGGAQEAIGYVGNSTSKNNTGSVGHLGDIYQFGDGSIDFDAKTKLDSGITVEFNAAYNVSANADGGAAVGGANGNGVTAASSSYSPGFKTKGNAFSEGDWIAFSGSFGKFEFGDDFNAAFQAHNDAPYFGMIGGYSWGRNSGYIAGPHLAGSPQFNIQTVMQDDYEATKVVYTTPSFGGFGVSVSYTPYTSSGDLCCGASSTTSTVSGGDATSAAIFYKGDMGDAKISGDVAATHEAGGNTRGIDAGLSVSMKGFTVGGSFLNRATESNNASKALKLGDSVGNTWDIGVGYETGPWGVTLGYMHASAYAQGATGNAGKILTGDLKWDEVPVTIKYNLGPGITLNSELGYAKWTTPDGQSRDQISGIYGLVGTTVSF